MYFHCHTIERDGWSVVSVVGELDLAGVPEARAAFGDAVGRHRPPRVVVDLTGVEFIDSMGLGVVVGALKRVRADGGELRVAVASDRVRKVFTLTGLDSLVPLVGSLDEAIESAGETDG